MTDPAMKKLNKWKLLRHYEQDPGQSVFYIKRTALLYGDAINNDYMVHLKYENEPEPRHILYFDWSQDAVKACFTWVNRGEIFQ